MTLRKLIENTIADSSPSWTIRWTTSTAGSWKSSQKVMFPPSANILTPPPANRASARRIASIASRALVLIFCATLFLIANSGALAQSPPHKKKKPKHPSSPFCQTGCQPDTNAPALDSSTPEDAAAQKELAVLARDLHHSAPGSYDKFAAFANKHS